MAVLLLQERPTSSRRTPSQGDAGVDVFEPLEGGFHVLQIKGFTGRMNADRWRQVSDSLRRVIDDPRLDKPIKRWSLVVPIDPTSQEEQRFRDLTGQAPFDCEWLGETFWHSQASAYPYVIDYYLRDGKGRLEGRVKTLGQLIREPGDPVRPSDVLSTLHELRRELNAADPHYRYEYATHDSSPQYRPRPNLVLSATIGFPEGGYATVDVFARYPQAVEDRPIGGTLHLVLQDAERGLDITEAVRSFIEYGREVDLPEGGIAAATLDAPGGLGGEFGEGAGRIGPAKLDPFVPHRERLELCSRSGSVEESVVIEMVSATRGTRGIEVHGHELANAFEVTVLLNAVDSAAQGARRATLTFRVSAIGGVAARIRPGIRFLHGLHAPNRLVWRPEYGPDTFSEMQLPDQSPVVIPQDFLDLLEAIADLQDFTTLPLTVPETITVAERESANRAHRLIRGATLSYTWDTVELVIPDERLEALREALAAGRDLGLDSTLTLRWQGTELVLGRLAQVFRRARVGEARPSSDGTIVILQSDGTGVVEEKLLT